MGTSLRQHHRQQRVFKSTIQAMMAYTKEVSADYEEVNRAAFGADCPESPLTTRHVHGLLVESDASVLVR
jgi:hypothetical protein